MEALIDRIGSGGVLNCRHNQEPETIIGQAPKLNL